ncbi:hypothetical protein KVH22_25185 [Streptomyces olivaceus]|uniref:hypothetical protein n=1 Tax=Streptomyces olivaceus TaxID=47716 RepID=UPI001CCE97CB|nr:hypothetical protein [Streptomyces olivaceus]MBZ6258812.1 hypothetical protein [Streptomyces olivaceus]
MTAPATPRSFPTPGDVARRVDPATAFAATAAAAASARAARAGTRAERRAARAAVPYTPVALSAAEGLAPGKLTRDEHFRKYYVFGVRRSRMPSSARLLAHDLVWRAGHHNGRISPNARPAPEHLAEATGLTVAQVDVALNTLTTRGWLTHRRLTDGPRAGSNQWVLAIPAAALEDIRAFLSTRPDPGHTR